VPHHHHPQNTKTAEHCHHHGHHHHNHDELANHVQFNHSHGHEAHIHCSFEDDIIPSKKINLSTAYLLASLLEISFSTENNQKLADTYITPEIPEPHCRDVQLRGPPQFS
jgi:hypothetical protein